MRVLSVAFPFAPVRPDTPGGAEQVLLSLDGALCASGHSSLVVAREGSIVNGRLLTVPKVEGIIGDDSRARVNEACRGVVRRALEELSIDLVHMHGLDFHDYMPEEGVPVLVTLHLPLAWYPGHSLRPQRPDTFFNCVSTSQAASTPDGTGPFMCIENGVALDGYPEKTGGRYALSMGRICPEKGFHLAIDAAREAGVPFILAGAVFRYKAHENYFSQMIAPRLGAGCRFVGAAGLDKKKRLLAGALCLVAPSLAPETSSLVAMEALASGTPVVAIPNGALADIVEHGRTGFLVNDQREMSLAIRACADIPSEACRRAAWERFSSKAMVERYFEAYGKIIGMQG